MVAFAGDLSLGIEFPGDMTSGRQPRGILVGIESTSHCLLVCPHVKTIWRKIWSWWNLANLVSFPSFDVLDISMNKIADLGCSRLNKVIHGVFRCGLWAIWKWRNKLVHASLDDRPKALQEDIFSSIQRLSKIWILARCKIPICNWSCWIMNPRSLLDSA
ncbi:hypothetical protein Tco_0753113 [Tanacetum coccineum]